MLKDIEKLIKQTLPRQVIPGFEPDPTAKAQPIQLRSGAPGHANRGRPGGSRGGQGQPRSAGAGGNGGAGHGGAGHGARPANGNGGGNGGGNRSGNRGPRPGAPRQGGRDR